MSFIEESYARQTDHFAIKDSEIHERFELDSIDTWRHGRMYDCIIPLIDESQSWVTIGDGRYGSDAYFLQKRGVGKVLPTDLSETLLKIGKKKGIISEYRIENAEKLSFKDNSFDWAFCKEAYHHFPRPMIALYEMLRVAREGIVLIEPNDGVIESRHEANLFRGWEIFKRSMINSIKRSLGKPLFYPFGGYEEAGNFIYTISKREMEKVALGIDLPWVAFKGLNDNYEKGYETELAVDENPKFRSIQNKLRVANNRVARGKGNYALLVTVMGKNPLNQRTEDELKASDFSVYKLPRNTYISR